MYVCIYLHMYVYIYIYINVGMYTIGLHQHMLSVRQQKPRNDHMVSPALHFHSPSFTQMAAGHAKNGHKKHRQFWGTMAMVCISQTHPKHMEQGIATLLMKLHCSLLARTNNSNVPKLQKLRHQPFPSQPLTFRWVPKLLTGWKCRGWNTFLWAKTAGPVHQMLWAKIETSTFPTVFMEVSKNKMVPEWMIYSGRSYSNGWWLGGTPTRCSSSYKWITKSPWIL